MDISWLAWIFFAAFVILISMIGFTLFSLAKRGDERSRFIKTKAMATTFIWTVAILTLEMVRALISSRFPTSPFLLLVLVSFVFLVSLIVYKKKHGDLA